MLALRTLQTSLNKSQLWCRESRLCGSGRCRKLHQLSIVVRAQHQKSQHQPQNVVRSARNSMSDDARVCAAKIETSVVFVHGAWHGTEYWNAVRMQLSERGVESVAVDLPSCGLVANPFEADVTAVQEELSLLADQAKEVVLVMHSYGGRVGSAVSASCSSSLTNGPVGLSSKQVGHALSLLLAGCARTEQGSKGSGWSAGWHCAPGVPDMHCIT